MYVGIDVSKSYLDVKATTWKEAVRYKNTSNGIKKLARILEEQGPELVVMEATGGYERAVAKELQAAGTKKAVVNPWRTRNFAKSIGLKAKTDPIDASVLARYSEAIKPEPTAVLSDQDYELKQLMERRIQLMEQKTQELNRLQHDLPEKIKKSIRAMLKAIKGQIKTVTGDIKSLIEKHECWKQKALLLQSAHGIGEIVAYSFCAFLPELGALDRKKIGALVGVVPYNHDSGIHSGKRCISGGRAEIRSLLYMATLTATRYNPKIKRFYKKLLAKGKAKKVALVACMRKFLVCLNALYKAQTPWKNSTK